MCVTAHWNFSHLTRKPTICKCENKGADQLRSNREADQRLYFRYTDSTLPLLLKSESSSLQSASVTVQSDLFGNHIVGFLMRRLNFVPNGRYVLFVNNLCILGNDCTSFLNKMSRLMGKPTICIGENKDADQLRGNREADQRLCFRYSHSTNSSST